MQIVAYEENAKKIYNIFFYFRENIRAYYLKWFRKSNEKKKGGNNCENYDVDYKPSYKVNFF